jgi:hypothetical protein
LTRHYNKLFVEIKGDSLLLAGREKSVTLTERLVEAESAYHDLMTGRSARVIVDSNGERVEYTPASAPRLFTYITELKRQLGLVGQGLGPMRVYF